MPERALFTTEDGVRIAGVFEPVGAGTEKAVLFLHMMPATKESWASLAGRLAGLGIASLAIDLRGHGESVEGPDGTTLDHAVFTDAQHREKRKDVDAAMRWLARRGFPSTHVALVGASIGANLAIDRAAAYGDTPAVVALSPGLDYRGVATEASSRSMPRAQKLLLAASEEDAYSFESAQELARLKPDAEFHALRDAGHGTRMLETVDGFGDFVARWLQMNLP